MRYYDSPSRFLVDQNELCAEFSGERNGFGFTGVQIDEEPSDVSLIAGRAHFDPRGEKNNPMTRELGDDGSGN